ncbi:MAG: hypothetical protein QGD94_11015, partial [Planctomycetia bacterium]|nr:hypothetical protein [Planctomycetia bacterium]
MRYVRLAITLALMLLWTTGCAQAERAWVLTTDKPVRNLTCVSNGFMGVKVPVEGQGWTTKPRSRPHLIAGL